MDSQLSGIDVFVWEDQAKQITSGIKGLRDVGLIGALLAVVTLYIFLRRMGTTLLVCHLHSSFAAVYLRGHVLHGDELEPVVDDGVDVGRGNAG